MGKYEIHSDFKKYENIRLPLSPLLLPILNLFLKINFNRIKPAEGVLETKKRIPGYQGKLIELTFFKPKDIGENAPCLIYLHGGAFAFKAAPYHKNLICRYALKTSCKVIFVDYRLTPKYAFPVGVEDCYAAFDWVCNNTQALGVDKNKIAIGGDSAGGGLAAAVSLMARDRKALAICFQMLIYPVLDARQITDSITNYIDTPIWNSKLNKKMWQLYLKNGVTGKREYASPMEAHSFENLPDTYVEVSEFDCLRDEGKLFAEILRKNGINVELQKTTGTLHGFEIAKNSEIVNQSVEKRIAALKRAFKCSDDSSSSHE